MAVGLECKSDPSEIQLTYVCLRDTSQRTCNARDKTLHTYAVDEVLNF